MKTLNKPFYRIDDIVIYNDGYNIKIGKVKDIEWREEINQWVYKTGEFTFTDYSNNVNFLSGEQSYVINDVYLQVNS